MLNFKMPDINSLDCMLDLIFYRLQAGGNTGKPFDITSGHCAQVNNAAAQLIRTHYKISRMTVENAIKQLNIQKLNTAG